MNGLLRAILENPADETLRLIYADWLEENGESERAEFIRVQIELAIAVETPRTELRIRALRRSEASLLARNEHVWRRPLLSARVHDGEGRSSWQWQCEWRRGFVASVSCSLSDWCGEPCESCGGRGESPTYRYKTLSSVGGDACPDCHGTGRINAHGPQIVAVQPVEEVRITDPETRESFPHELTWGFLGPGGPPINLSDACVAWARREAGLPPLSKPSAPHVQT